MIVRDDPRRHEEVANRNKTDAPSQYTGSLFAFMNVVKSMTGLQCRYLQGLEAANSYQDSKSTIVAARVAPFKSKPSKGMLIEGLARHAWWVGGG